jgi:hypothetical protein
MKVVCLLNLCVSSKTAILRSAPIGTTTPYFNDEYNALYLSTTQLLNDKIRKKNLLNENFS